MWVNGILHVYTGNRDAILILVQDGYKIQVSSRWLDLISTSEIIAESLMPAASDYPLFNPGVSPQKYTSLFLFHTKKV